MAVTIGQLDAITRKYFVPKLYDNIFNSNALLNRAKTKKWYKKYDGGTKIAVPLAYAKTANTDWYSGDDTLTITDNDQMTDAIFDMKQAYANVTITRSDELKNSGKAQVINFVKTKMSLAEKSLSDKLGDGLYSDGYTDADALVGFQLMINDENNTGHTSYGEIDRASSNTWWNGKINSTWGAMTLKKLNTAYGTAVVGNDKPTVIVTTQTLFDGYMALLQSNQRYSDSKTADAGFQNLLLQGTPMVVDSHAPSGSIFMLNENYIDLFVHSKEDFRWSGFNKVDNKNVTVGQIFWAGALTCSNPRMQVQITGATA